LVWLPIVAYFSLLTYHFNDSIRKNYVCSYIGPKLELVLPFLPYELLVGVTAKIVAGVQYLMYFIFLVFSVLPLPKHKKYVLFGIVVIIVIISGTVFALRFRTNESWAMWAWYLLFCFLLIRALFFLY